MDEYRILIVEDDRSVRSFIETALSIQGYRCQTAHDGTAALCCLSKGDIDVILLDLGLPDIDGIEVIKNIRSWSSIPVIVVSARNDDIDKVAALDAGADDYLTKPFSIDELLARLRGTFRRLAYLMKENTEPSSLFRNGELSIDFEARTATIRGQEIHLTPTEYRLLTVLASNVGRVLTYSTILKSIRGSFLETDIASLRVSMVSLRRKLEVDPRVPVYVQTHIGIGYSMPRID